MTFIATTLGFISPPPSALVASLWPEISYLVLIAGVAAVFSWNIGIKILGPINGVLFINLVPLTTLFIGWFSGHSFNGFEYAGVSTVIGALLLNNLAARGLFGKLRLPMKRRRSAHLVPAE